MATKPLKLSDFYNFKDFPGGGFTIAKSTPSTMLKPPVATPQFSLNNVGPLNPTMTPSLQQLGQSMMIGPNGQFIQKPIAAPAPAVAPVRAPAPAPIQTPFNAPVVPGGAPGTAPKTQAQIPPQWLNPDGSFKTPDQVAADIGSTLKNSSKNGDVGKLALEQFGGEPTTEQAITQARRINNTRNDIAVGEKDPYKVASESGIAYTPSELSAIEKAYAGIYDPALDTALAKVQQKQEEDKIKLQTDAQNNQPFTLGKDQVRYDKYGNPIAVGISSDDGTGSGGLYQKGANTVVDAYIEGFNKGTYKASDIPDQYKDLVAQGIAQTKPELSKSSNDAISVIGQIQGSDILEQITGIPNVSTFLPGTKAQGLLNLTKQLKGLLSLENRQQLKGSGAISDFEFRILGDAASALGIGEGGRSNLSKEDFEKELNKLKLKLEVGETNLKDDELLYLQEQGYTPQQIRAYSAGQSFSSVGNTTASKTTGTGNIPQRNNNPGNVKTGGLSDSLAVGKDKYGHLIFPDAATGFKAMTADLTAKINGNSRHFAANPTIAQLGKAYAEDPNWPKKVAQMLGVSVDTHTKNIPLANLVKAIATQEGFYA